MAPLIRITFVFCDNNILTLQLAHGFYSVNIVLQLVYLKVPDKDIKYPLLWSYDNCMRIINQSFLSSNKLDVEELSDFALDQMYVDDNVLTNTDRILEDHITGSLRAWHLILIVAGGCMILSKKPSQNDVKQIITFWNPPICFGFRTYNLLAQGWTKCSRGPNPARWSPLSGPRSSFFTQSSYI